MYAKAEADVNAVVAELGADAPMKMPDTAYFLACLYSYLGIKVTTLGELQAALPAVRGLMTRNYKTKDIFTSGIGTAIAAEMIEACKYARSENPYEGTVYHGHFSDAEVRTLGVPLVTRDIPGFTVMIGPAPSVEEAVETVKGYQTRGIFVFLIGGIIDLRQMFRDLAARTPFNALDNGMVEGNMSLGDKAQLEAVDKTQNVAGKEK